MTDTRKIDSTNQTAVQEKDVENLIDALISAPRDKLTIMTVMAETFISGMKTQERLTASEGETIKTA